MADRDCSHACGGRCCQNFVIGSHTPERIGELYLNAKACEAAGVSVPSDRDIIFVAEMVIRIDEDDEWRARYTCKHFVEATGLCGVYDQRPKMCREFPYGKVCDYGCGYQNELPEGPALVQITKPESENERPAAA